jgi:hypothetical protein
MIRMSLQEASQSANREARGEDCALIQIIGRQPLHCAACGSDNHDTMQCTEQPPEYTNHDRAAN